MFSSKLEDMQCQIRMKYVAIRQQRTCRIATIWQTTSLPSALTKMLETISGLSQFIQQRHTPDNVRRLLKTSKS